MTEMTGEQWNEVQRQAARMMLQDRKFVIVKVEDSLHAVPLFEVCELRNGTYFALDDLAPVPKTWKECQMIVDGLKKQAMVTIELPEEHTACIIIEKETGVSYTTQTGGHSCAHPVAEGYLVLLTYWDYDLARRLTEGLWAGRFAEVFLDPKCFFIDALTDLLWSARDGELKEIECVLDRERAKSETQCGEAWLPVICTHGKGWLTWPNSD